MEDDRNRRILGHRRHPGIDFLVAEIFDRLGGCLNDHRSVELLGRLDHRLGGAEVQQVEGRNGITLVHRFARTGFILTNGMAVPSLQNFGLSQRAIESSSQSQ
jgi:hypothetical protein